MGFAKNLLLILIAVALTVGCGVVSHSARTTASNTADKPSSPSDENPAGLNVADSTSIGSDPIRAMSLSRVNTTKSSLQKAYYEWRGTPYRWGGATKKGIDCSMFVKIVFEDYLGIDLPRTTRTQLNVGEGVRRSAIRTGDLVFFRTGRGRLHVGVVIDHGEFLHASSSEGVTITDLGKKYWTNRYLGARRVL